MLSFQIFGNAALLRVCGGDSRDLLLATLAALSIIDRLLALFLLDLLCPDRLAQ